MWQHKFFNATALNCQAFNEFGHKINALFNDDECKTMQSLGLNAHLFRNILVLMVNVTSFCGCALYNFPVF